MPIEDDKTDCVKELSTTWMIFLSTVHQFVWSTSGQESVRGEGGRGAADQEKRRISIILSLPHISQLESLEQKFPKNAKYQI